MKRMPLLVAGVLLLARTAAAQNSTFVTASGFADVKRFGTTSSVYVYSGDGTTMSSDGTAAGAGIRIGTFLLPRISLELSIDAGGTTTNDLSDLYPMGLPVRVPQVTESTRFLAVSPVLGFHPSARGRVHMGYLGGLAFLRAH